MSASSRRLVVHIERIVLEGLPLQVKDGPLVQSALEAELTRLLTRDGLASALATGGAIASLPRVEVAGAAGREPSALGLQVAQALHGALGPTGGTP